MSSRLKFLRLSSFAVFAAMAAIAHTIPSATKPAVIVSTAAEPMAKRKFAPTWESLSQYEVPGGGRDAKFGL